MDYIKIAAIYARDTNGSKKLIEGKFQNDAVEYLRDCTWQFTEKVDGTNCGIVWDGHRVRFQGRTADADIPATLVNHLLDLFGSPETEELFEQKFGSMSVILFGEGYGGKIGANGPKYCKAPRFILFDVYIPSQNLWMTRESVEDIAKTFGIDAVPVIMEGPLDDGVAYVKEGHTSTLSDGVKMEGLVARPKVEVLDRRGRRVIVKIKYRDFQ